MLSCRDTLIGIDVGGTKCLGVAVGSEFQSDPVKHPTPRQTGDLLDLLVTMVEQLGMGMGGRLAGLGVGLPGWVDEKGRLEFAPNLPQLVGVDVATELAQRLGLPVHAENDATCAAWGEFRAGAGLGLESVVLVTIGTGIGCGVVAGGQPYRGAHGFSGEVGHTIVDPLGPTCACGQRGCWEVFASGTALGRLVGVAARGGKARRVVELAGNDPGSVRGEHVTRAAREGDPEANAILAELARWVAVGLFNIASVLDPDAIILGGGLPEAGEVFLQPVRVALHRLWSAVATRPPIRVVPATLGERAGAIGAAYLALDGSVGA